MISSTLASGAGSSTRRRRRVPALLGASLAALALGGCSAAHSASTAAGAYGSLPSYLPSPAVQPDSELTGTAARPALTSQGDSIKVELADDATTTSVHAVVSGPEVPGEGLPVVTAATTCTWTVSLTGASRAVPIRAGDFTAIDHLGKIYRPTFVPGQPQPPDTLLPGRTVTFELRTVMAAGEGLMRWAPGNHRILASWDFEVEND